MSDKSTDMAIVSSEYTRILKMNGLSWKTDGYYLVCGDFIETHSSRIYVSVVISQISTFLKAILPILRSYRADFAVVKDEHSAAIVLNGVAGHMHVGKVLILSIRENQSDFLKKIAPILEEFDGPVLPGKTLLAKNIYSDDPTSTATGKRFFVLGGKYIVTSSLKNDPKGEVLNGFYLSRFGFPRRCIIKEGKKFMISDASGRDMSDRLEWQRQISERLSSTVLIPRVIDLFSEDGNSFLVMEKINGKAIGNVIEEIYGTEDWISLSNIKRMNLIKRLINIIDIVVKVHQNGLLHRDLSKANFLVDSRDNIYLIDWELAFDIKAQYPLPPFGFGTPGFISPEQNRGEVPSVKEDVFGLSALMMVFYTGQKPTDAFKRNYNSIMEFIILKTGEHSIAKLITKGLDPCAANRPDLADIRAYLSRSYLEYLNA